MPPQMPPADVTGHFNNSDAQRLREVQDKLGQLGPSALCLSGGGIRSATFCLGVLQMLASCGLLEKFDYLSTVSGGGYIGSWLSAWRKHSGHSIEKVSRDLGRLLTARSIPGSSTDEVARLRDFTSYLTPIRGVFSADTWTLSAIYLRNLLLNWLILLPLLASVLMAPRLTVAFVRLPKPVGCGALLILLGSAFHLLATTYLDRHRPGDDGAPSPGDTQLRFLGCCLFPLIVSACLLTLAWTALRQHAADSLSPLQWAGLASSNSPSGPWLKRPLPLPSLDIGWALLGFLIFKWFLGSCVWAIMWVARRGTTKVAGLWELFATVVVCSSLSAWLLWIAAKLSMFDPLRHPRLYACIAVPAYLLTFLLAGALLRGLLSFSNSDAAREWAARAAAWVLIALVGWTGAALLVVYGPSYLLRAGAALKFLVLSTGGMSGVAAALLGASAKTPATSEQTRTLDSGVVRKIALTVAAPAFILFSCVLVALATDGLITRFWTPPAGSLLHALSVRLAALLAALFRTSPPGEETIHDAVIVFCPWWILGLWTVGLLSLLMSMSRFIDVNKFSLHTTYRNRLTRAYLGSAHLDREKSYDRFTGFNPRDDFPVHELPDERPLHVLNIALNLVHGERLAWQERKAESFTVTRLHCGSPVLGYRQSKDYGGAITLGTAMAVSGAAANPNMGYHSSPPVAFLMTLFNVRLGVWLGNPGESGGRRRPLIGRLCRPTFACASPRLAFRPLVQEALGLTNDRNPYVNLSDGGHFENLGLYEMVHRRCRRILVCDTGHDPSCGFEDLGNAIRKIYIDMGVRITFRQQLLIRPRRPQDATAAGQSVSKYCAMTTIHYSQLDTSSDDAYRPPERLDGELLYIKPAPYGDEPVDIFSYAQRSLEFPHESTANQFFTESQFESYRGLGEHIMREILESPPRWPATLEELFTAAGNYLGKQS